MLTPQVEEEVLVLLSIELEKLRLTPTLDGKLVLVTCQDGLILIFPALDVAAQARMNLVRVYEATLRSTGSEVLIQYFEANRAGKEMIEDFALSFMSGWNNLVGRAN